MSTGKSFPWKVGWEATCELGTYLYKVNAVEVGLVCGSLRRDCPEVHDGDLVVLPKFAERTDLFGTVENRISKVGPALEVLCKNAGFKLKKNGDKIATIERIEDGFCIDVYQATPETYWLTVLIRTGSAQHNVKLCKRAISLGMTLHADGSGIRNSSGTLLPVKSEEHAFSLLQTPFLAPSYREV